MPAQDHPVFEKPDDAHVKIWRYMSLAKFLSLLQTSALYFSRSDKMGDPFECHYTKITALSEDAYVAAHMADPRFAKINEGFFRSKFKKHLENIAFWKTTLFVNCWHMNEYESLAMWKLYAAQNESICIQSTFDILHGLLPEDSFLGTVKYIDYNKDSIGMETGLNYIVHKRRSFEHERELRAVMWLPTLNTKFPIINDRGISIPIKTDSLIQNIFISPSSDSLLGEVVNGIKASYRLSAPVHKSSANDGPDY